MTAFLIVAILWWVIEAFLQLMLAMSGGYSAPTSRHYVIDSFLKIGLVIWAIILICR